MRIAFVPACLVASHEATGWRELFEFGRRQFLITRVSAAATWWFGLFSSLYSVLGLWGGAALALYASRRTGPAGATISLNEMAVFAAVPVVFFLGQLTRAILRQRMARKILDLRSPIADPRFEIENRKSKIENQMRAACWADCVAFWVWSLVLLFLIVSSAFGRTIRWRGIRYKLLSATQTIVVGKEGI
jgi:hypothetical protein